jgi:hypothetical protein
LRVWLPKLQYPIRVGEHSQTAFAFGLVHDWANVTRDTEMLQLIDSKSRAFYGADRNCPLAYEPSGEDFLSPCLAEADVVRRVLPTGVFQAWLEDFLPDPDGADPAPILEPPVVRDRQDPRIGHLIGLDFHRAWALEGVASALPAAGPHAAAWRSLAARHRAAGLKDMLGSGYGGEHWLASFVLYLLTGAGR